MVVQWPGNQQQLMRTKVNGQDVSQMDFEVRVLTTELQAGMVWKCCRVGVQKTLPRSIILHDLIPWLYAFVRSFVDRILRTPNPPVASVIQKFLALEAMQKYGLNGKMVDVYYLICLSNISDPPIGQVKGRIWPPEHHRESRRSCGPSLRVRCAEWMGGQICDLLPHGGFEGDKPWKRKLKIENWFNKMD